MREACCKPIAQNSNGSSCVQMTSPSCPQWILTSNGTAQPVQSVIVGLERSVAQQGSGSDDVTVSNVNADVTFKNFSLNYVGAGGTCKFNDVTPTFAFSDVIDAVNSLASVRKYGSAPSPKPSPGAPSSPNPSPNQPPTSSSTPSSEVSVASSVSQEFHLLSALLIMLASIAPFIVVK